METQEREYWLAGGADLAKAEDFFAKRDAASDTLEATAKKYGGSAVSRGPYIAGLLFELDVCPLGWSKRGEVWDEDRGRHRPFYMPKRTSKALRAISDDLSGAHLKVPSGREFTALMLPGQGVGVMAPGGHTGIRLLYASWEHIGSDLILSIPLKDGASIFTPDGSTHLPMSEYWRRKEAAAEAAKAKADD